MTTIRTDHDLIDPPCDPRSEHMEEDCHDAATRINWALAACPYLGEELQTRVSMRQGVLAEYAVVELIQTSDEEVVEFWTDPREAELEFVAAIDHWQGRHLLSVMAARDNGLEAL